jgi:hypothetical protein
MTCVLDLINRFLVSIHLDVTSQHLYLETRVFLSKTIPPASRHQCRPGKQEGLGCFRVGCWILGDPREKCRRYYCDMPALCTTVGEMSVRSLGCGKKVADVHPHLSLHIPYPPNQNKSLFSAALCRFGCHDPQTKPPGYLGILP